jgi:hypothetical protein
MSLEMNYSKSKKIDLAHLEKQYELLNESSTIEYNPFKIKALQNYNPIYSLFFEMTQNNYNVISLNHSKHFVDLETIQDEITTKKTNLAVHIKYAPLLDPIHYLIGKYEKEKALIHNLPNMENKLVLNKIKSPNNSAYTDCFFCYLSSKLYEKHGFLNAIDFYGSYLGIQEKFRMDITDDYEYLQESPFFRNNKKKICEIESIGFSPEFFKQTTNPKLILGDVCDLQADIELDEIECKNDASFETDLELVYEKCEKEDGEDVIDDDESEDSSNNSQVNDSSHEEDDLDDIKEEEEEEEEENNESEWSDMEDSENEPTIFAYIHNIPVQMICLEKCEGTFDSLLEEDELDEDQITSALFQVIMTLAAYQHVFSFTHNDLHTNNIVYVSTDIEFIEYHYLQKNYKVPTYGRIFKIIDFGRAIYRFQDQILCSDSFSIGGDAHSQYNIEPFLNKNKPRLEPNMSFDLCRLGCSMYDFVFENEDEEVIQQNKTKWTKIQKLIYEWCTDDTGKNILYKSSGEERYPNFKLYKMIARIVHKHTPDNQLLNPIFTSYLQNKKDKKNKKQKIIAINIDSIPKYYS